MYIVTYHVPIYYIWHVHVQEQREALASCIDDDSYVYEALEKVY